MSQCHGSFFSKQIVNASMRIILTCQKIRRTTNLILAEKVMNVFLICFIYVISVKFATCIKEEDYGFDEKMTYEPTVLITLI